MSRLQLPSRLKISVLEFLFWPAYLRCQGIECPTPMMDVKKGWVIWCGLMFSSLFLEFLESFACFVPVDDVPEGVDVLGSVVFVVDVVGVFEDV